MWISFKPVRLAQEPEITPVMFAQKLCNLGQKPPPGKLIYQKDPHAIYEVNGEEDQASSHYRSSPRNTCSNYLQQLFTQNLSLFAKLFLDNKSVFYDVSSFNYYLLVYSQPTPSTMSSQVVGFFSKEKLSWDNNNLACILVFPPWQRQGLGKILMSVSYELSKREGRIGGPERPLSELGRKGYIRFWQARVAATIVEMKSKATLSIGEISERCWMLTDDVITALQEMDLFTPLNKQADGESIVVNKAQIRQWINARGIDLTPLIHEGAFLDKWHLKLPQSEEP